MAEKSGPPTNNVYVAPSNPPPYESSVPPVGSYPHPQPTSYPQQPSYPPPPPAATVTVVSSGPNFTGVVVGSPVGTQPTLVTCRSCGAQIVTRVEFTPSIRTHLMALLLCLFACWPCVCVPYCMDSCNNAEHYCTNCGAYVGSYLN